MWSARGSVKGDPIFLHVAAREGMRAELAVGLEGTAERCAVRAPKAEATVPEAVLLRAGASPAELQARAEKRRRAAEADAAARALERRRWAADSAARRDRQAPAATPTRAVAPPPPPPTSDQRRFRVRLPAAAGPT